jgi:hypothetical protein
MKKGQVTVFIIIAVAIVVVIGGVVYFNAVSKDGELDKTGLQAHPVNALVQFCLDQTLKDGIEFIGLQGGYYDEPVLSKYYLFHNIPYYWNEGESGIPDMTIVQRELSEYIKDNLIFCVNDFVVFENENYEVKSNDLKIDSLSILEGSVEVDVTYPIIVQSVEKTVEFKNFESSVQSELKMAYDLANQIIEEQKKTPNLVPLSFIMDLSSDNNFRYETVQLEEDDILYTLLLGSEDRPYIYAFVADYDWENQEKFGEIEI